MNQVKRIQGFGSAMKRSPQDGPSVDVKAVKGGQVDITIRCACGKPIVVSNEFGMVCEDRCREQEAKRAKVKIDKMMKEFLRGL